MRQFFSTEVQRAAINPFRLGKYGMDGRGKINLNSSILGSRSLGLNDISGSNQQSLGFGREQKERE